MEYRTIEAVSLEGLTIKLNQLGCDKWVPCGGPITWMDGHAPIFTVLLAREVGAGPQLKVELAGNDGTTARDDPARIDDSAAEQLTAPELECARHSARITVGTTGYVEPDAHVDEMHDGYYVQAWVWVPKE